MDALARSRRVWFVITGAIALVTILYAILLFVLLPQGTASRLPGSLPTLLRVIAVVDLAAAVAWTRFGWRGTRAGDDSEPLVPPARFMQYSIVSLALAESAAIVGFVQVVAGAPAMTYVPYGAGALLVIGAVIVPAGLAYWSDLEAAAGGSAKPIG